MLLRTCSLHRLEVLIEENIQDESTRLQSIVQQLIVTNLLKQTHDSTIPYYV